MPTKGKGEPSCKSIEGSPTLAGAHSAKVSTKILWLRAGSRLVTPDFSDKNVCHIYNSSLPREESVDQVSCPLGCSKPPSWTSSICFRQKVWDSNQYVESRRDLADPVSKGLGKDLVSRTWRGMGKVHSFHSFGLYIHNDTMSALGRLQDMFSDTAIQLQPVFAQWIQNTHTLAPGATAPGATASTSLTWGGGDLVAVGGKVALLPIPLGTADFLVHHIHAFTIHVTVNLPIANARLQSTPLPLVSPSEPRTRSLTSFLFLPSGRVTSSSPSCLPASSSYGHGPWFYQHLRFP
ncbi:hypothetical protein V6N13_109256 [Hibiscus sabdariffa]